MRLLSTRDLSFREFFEGETPEYSILSHTWGKEEVTFKEMRKWPPGLDQRSGMQKIVDCARVSRRRGYEWTWIDTCCIDKRSGAELSEAINSMYTWYKKSAACFVYLAEFPCGGSAPVNVENWSEEMKSQFRRCRWFTRGRTLQELIAP